MGTSEQDDTLVALSVACGSAEEAGKIGRELVEKRLAACAQVWPIQSTYRWQGQVEAASEHMLLAKTLVEALPAAEALIRTLHSYEVPEMVAQPVAWASADYAAWVRASVQRQEDT